jgi:hypothetical protein
MKYLLNGIDITSTQFVAAGIQYPSNWCAKSAQADRDALGIITLTETYPAITAAQKYDGTYTDSQTGLAVTRTYTVVNKSATEVSAFITSAIKSVDADVDAIYQDAVGNRTSEYQVAKDAATAYKTAGYTGTVPATVQNWANLNYQADGVTLQTPQWAADNILASATNLANAQLSIRQNRLSSKSQLKAATGILAAQTILNSWAAYVVQMRMSLGI